MNIKLFLFLLSTLNFSCEENKTPSTKSVKDYTIEIEHIQQFSKQHKYNQDIAFMIDYSLHSGLNRFFVVDLKKGIIIKKGLVCHGSCKGQNSNGKATVFSNTNESYCTTLGMAVVAERAYSKWGKNYKYWLDGLEEINTNMRKRVVVLHAWEHVPDKEMYPKSLALSWGCPTVSIQFLDELDVILKENDKVLLYSFE